MEKINIVVISHGKDKLNSDSLNSSYIFKYGNYWHDWFDGENCIKNKDILDKFPFISRYYFKKCNYSFINIYDSNSYKDIIEKGFFDNYDIVIYLPNRLHSAGSQRTSTVYDGNIDICYERLNYKLQDFITKKNKYLLIYDGIFIKNIIEFYWRQMDSQIPHYGITWKGDSCNGKDEIKWSIDEFILQKFKTKLNLSLV